jgi:hypothetical protein
VPEMHDDERATFTAHLAERGLEIQSYDGHTLALNYNSAADRLIDKGYTADRKQLAGYAQSLLQSLPMYLEKFSKRPRLPAARERFDGRITRGA